MITKLRRNATTLAALGLITLAPAAWATECRNSAYWGLTNVEMQVANLKLAIDPVGTDYKADGFTNAIDQMSMLSKADEALDKIVSARGGPKWDDAIQKLYDIDYKVDSLVGARKQKLTDDRADAIKTALGTAAGCFSN